MEDCIYKEGANKYSREVGEITNEFAINNSWEMLGCVRKENSLNSSGLGRMGIIGGR